MQLNAVPQSGGPLELPLKDQAGPVESTPLLADLDEDGSPEIIVGSGGGLVYGFRADGSPLPGFPLGTVGAIRTTPLIDDLDVDGALELVVCTDAGSIHLWHLDRVDPSYTGTRVFWGELGGGPGSAGQLRQDLGAQPPVASTPLLPRGRVYCYPNPVRESSARIRFYLGDEARVEVTVLNALGEIVDRLAVESTTPRMENEIAWDTSGYASGLYICRVEAVGVAGSEVRFVKAAVVR
jgi:hypothetical protein